MSELAAIVVGANDVRLWGLDTQTRTQRIAKARGLSPRSADDPVLPALLVNAGHVFDPAWATHLRDRPGEALTLAGVPVLAHVRTAEERASVERAMLADVPLGRSSLSVLPHESGIGMTNNELRKKEHPFALRLVPESVRAAERASYFGAYKGVTDLLTKYLWPEWALVLTRAAARFGVTPNMVTGVGALLCLLATWLFWYGHYWWGMAAGLGFMVLDTVDGKLARCTITSSAIGNVFDHGIDLVHPPFWWWAWAVGLSAWGLALPPGRFALVLGTIIVGYVVQRAIEGVFLRRFGMHIHVWRKLDSDFRLITARRNPNMVILFVSLLFARPDIGLTAVAWWTAISCLFHLVRLVQALALPGGRGAVRSWLA